MPTILLAHTVVIVMAIYIPPQANVKMALEQLYDVISGQQNKHPDGVLLSLGILTKHLLRLYFPDSINMLSVKLEEKIRWTMFIQI